MTQLEYNDVVIISYWMSEIYSVYLLVLEETGYQQELFYMHVCIDRTTHSYGGHIGKKPIKEWVLLMVKAPLVV